MFHGEFLVGAGGCFDGCCVSRSTSPLVVPSSSSGTVVFRYWCHLKLTVLRICEGRCPVPLVWLLSCLCVVVKVLVSPRSTEESGNIPDRAGFGSVFDHPLLDLVG